METSSYPSIPKILQDVEISQECKDLISSLPKGKGCIQPTMYQYQSFWYYPKILQGVISLQKHYQVQDTDILIATAPKSGTTWLKAISYAVINRTRYPVKSENHPLLVNNSHELVPNLDIIYAKNPNPDLSMVCDDPRLFSTHIPFISLPESVRNCNCKIVYMCRDPKDVFVSSFHFANKLRSQDLETNSIEEMFNLFCKGVSRYGPTWDHVLGFWHESLKRPEKVLFLKYEEMKEQPHTQVRKLAEFFGCPFTPQEEKEGIVDAVVSLCSFENLSRLDVNKQGSLAIGVMKQAFFRRGEAGDWVNHLTVEMAQELDTITEQKLHGSGLKFQVTTET